MTSSMSTPATTSESSVNATSIVSAASPPLPVDLVRFQHSLKPRSTNVSAGANVEYSDESVKGILAEAKNVFAAFASGDSYHSSSLLPVFSTFLSWLWKREVMQQLISAQWSMDEWIEQVFPFFDAPFPAAEVFSAFAAATRLYVPPPSPSSGVTTSSSSGALSSIHSFLATCLQRFLSQSRLADALQQLCESESTRKHPPKAAASAYSVLISPLSQSLIDQLSSFPDVLFNTLQRNVPYSLSQKEWHGGLVAAILQVIHTNAEKKDASFVAPLSALVTKLTRLGQSEVVIDGLLNPLIAHIQQRLTSDASSSSSFSLAASPASQSATSRGGDAFSSPFISHLSVIVCNVGVQSMESFIVSLFQWLGVRWRYTATEKQKFVDTNTSIDKEVLQYEAALQSVCPSIFPLKFFQTSSFFSLLVTRKLLTHKVALSPGAQHVLADYVGFMSSAALGLLPPQERTHKRVGHETILDQCLLTTIQAWVGNESGSRGHESSVATAMAADMQMALGRAILFLLVKVEETLNSSPLPAAAASSSSSSSGFKLDPENADLATKDDGAPINSLTSFANSPCVPLLLTGIHTRLSSPLVHVRRNAMKIAKQFSRLMGGKENELDFEGEELEPHEKSGRSKSSTNPFDEDDDEHMQDENTMNANLTPASIINPLHVSSPSNASAFQAYSLADDEKDLRKVKPPAFLREALEYLQKKLESHDHVEAALEALPGLIRRHPADLPVLTGQLLASLVNVGSNVFVETHEKLAKWRIEALVALCSTSRGADIRVLSQSVQYLIAQFYGQSHSLGVKLEILSILLKAAEYLADMNQEEHNASFKSSMSVASSTPLIQEVSSSKPGSSLVPINTPIYNSGSSAKEVSNTLAHHQAIIRERVEKRTKRWGSTKLNKDTAEGAVAKSSKPERHYSVNRFTEVSHLFFYPLMKPLDEPAALLQLQQHDSLLLMRLLHTVSAFIPCCSGLAQTLPMAARRMSKVLMEYLLMSAHRIDMNRLSIRAQSSAAMPAAAQVGMRRMIFFALSRILVSYNEALFADDFPHELPELTSWLTDAVENDKDMECRQLAQANLYFLRELLGNPFENLFKQGSNSAASTASMISAQLPPLKF